MRFLNQHEINTVFNYNDDTLRRNRNIMIQGWGEVDEKFSFKLFSLKLCWGP